MLAGPLILTWSASMHPAEAARPPEYSSLAGSSRRVPCQAAPASRQTAGSRGQVPPRETLRHRPLREKLHEAAGGETSAPDARSGSFSWPNFYRE